MSAFSFISLKNLFDASNYYLLITIYQRPM